MLLFSPYKCSLSFQLHVMKKESQKQRASHLLWMFQILFISFMTQLGAVGITKGS